MYGSVLLGISSIVKSNQIDFETDCIFVAAKVMSSRHVVIFTDTYRPARSDQTYMDSVNREISTLCHTETIRGWELYISLKAQHRRPAYNNYLIKTITSDQCGSKQLCALLKSKHLGVPPHKEGNIIYCDPVQKTNIFNSSFTPIFFNDTTFSHLVLVPSPYLSMDDATISCEGVIELRMNYRLHKVGGPDDIPRSFLERQQNKLLS